MKISHLERENQQLKQQLASLQQLLPGLPLDAADDSELPQSPVMIYRLERSAAGRIAFLFVSESCCEILGLTSRQILSDVNLVWDRIHPDDRTRVIEGLDQPIKVSERCSCQYRIVNPQGEIKTLRTILIPSADAEGTTVVWNGLLAAVSPRQAAEIEPSGQLQGFPLDACQISALIAEKEALRRLLMLQDRDRKQISHDIHDGFIQYAVAAHMHLESLARRMKQSQSPIPPELDRVRELVDQAIVEGRCMIGEIRPSLIEESGMLGAIQQLIDGEGQKGLDVRLRSSMDQKDFDADLGRVVFRIIQEALANVRRHAQVKKAFVRITASAEKLRVIVRDRGVGFVIDDVAEGHFGLEGIRERAELYYGQTQIRSRPGRGTLLIVELPFNQTARSFVAP